MQRKKRRNWWEEVDICFWIFGDFGTCWFYGICVHERGGGVWVSSCSATRKGFWPIKQRLCAKTVYCKSYDNCWFSCNVLFLFFQYLLLKLRFFFLFWEHSYELDFFFIMNWFFFFINMGIRVSLRITQLISWVLKLTIIYYINNHKTRI